MDPQLLKHQKSVITCSMSVRVCTADFPPTRKQRAKRGDSADTLSILNTFARRWDLNYLFHAVTVLHCCDFIAFHSSHL